MQTKAKSFSSFIFILLIAITFFAQQVFQKKTNIITWDVYGYYVLLPATFIYHDVQHFNFAEKNIQQHEISNNLYQIQQLKNGNRIPIYTIGFAIAHLPFFIIADIFTQSQNYFARDGLSFPYQLALLISCLFYCFIGLFYLQKFLLKYFSFHAVCIALLCIVFGTNYFNYVVFDAAMPHALLFALYGILIFKIAQWFDKQTLKTGFIIGILYALVFLIRPTELVSLMFFIFYPIGKTMPFKKIISFWKQNFRLLIPIFLMGFSIIFLQIFYWHFVTRNGFIFDI